jgi:hypothetical protein
VKPSRPEGQGRGEHAAQSSPALNAAGSLRGPTHPIAEIIL